MNRLVLSLALVVFTTPLAEGQDLNCAEPDLTAVCTSPAQTYHDQFCRVVQTIVSDSSKRSTAKQACVEKLIDISGGNLGAFLQYAQARSKSMDIAAIENARTDKQVGAPGNSGGSGSVVSKGAVPAILGFAVENGALTQETSDTTITLRGNLVGWLDLIQSQGFIDSYQDDAFLVRQLRRLSYSLTLNTDTGSEAAAETSGGFSPAALREQLRETGQQLAGFSWRVALIDRRDPRTLENRASVATLLEIARGALRADNFLDVVLNDDYYSESWVKETSALLSDPGLNAAAVERALYRQIESLRLYMRDHIDNFDERVTRAVLALEGFDQARLKVFQAMQKHPLFAFEYLHARGKQIPDTSTLRLILEGQWGPRIDLTANIALTLQQEGTLASTAEAIPGGLRDMQAAVQLDMPLAGVSKSLAPGGGIGVPVLGVAYLFERLQSKGAISFAGQTFNVEAGNVHLVQAQVTIPVKGSGMRIPFSVSYSNRTDLIKEKTIRGHIGLTFDLDVLSALRP